MNHDTVDYVSRNLPPIVCNAVDNCCQTSTPSSAAISEILAQAIASIEASIVSDFQALFPKGARSLMHADSQRLKQLINDPETSNMNYCKVARVLGGTTILITLCHENTDELWVANLGDSCASKCITFH